MSLKNRYCILRHGESAAYVAKIILSDPCEGVREMYSLTFKGCLQVDTSVEGGIFDFQLNKNTIICSSPFSRTRKSAHIARDRLESLHSILFFDELRERYFGEWEATENTNYQKVWDEDVKNPDHTLRSVESANQVQRRGAQLVGSLEYFFQGKTILLVSHGDALQILQTWFLGISAAMHRSVKHLELAEIRQLHFKGEKS